MSKVLVIGGAGYVGSVLCAELLSRGYLVRAFDNFVYGHNVSLLSCYRNSSFEFFYGDIRASSQVNAALDGITDVILLAGLVGDPITKAFPEEAHLVNDIGIQSTIKALNGRGLRRVIFASTCSNYGLIKATEVANEGFTLAPLSLYSKSKVAAEQHLLALRGSIDYQPTVLRFATAFGLSPRMRFDLTISEFTRSLVLGSELTVYDPDTWRPYCHVRDFAEIMHRVLQADNDTVGFETFNAGSDANNFTKRQIVDLILANVPGGRVKFVEKGSDPRNYRVDFSKLRERLGFDPRISVAQGIEELVDALNNRVFDFVESSLDRGGNYTLRI